jgi:phosphoribosylaminoimidazolecarboxamide formyltransferase/IMP cyclohydrolase
MELRAITRSLVSVSDKANLGLLAGYLAEHDIEIVSTGGTLRDIVGLGMPATSVSDFTGSPEVMDGRVKTLHPKVFGGVLFRRDKHPDWYALGQLGSKPIDLVVVNLYPFIEKLTVPGITHEELIENIDIGGPSLLRAAAKNYRDVVVITTTDYHQLIDHLEAHGGQTTLAFREQCAAQVFALTAEYEQAIADYFAAHLAG